MHIYTSYALSGTSTYYGGGVPGQGYVPVSLRYVPTESLVTSVTLSSAGRNDFSGWVGFQFTVGSSPMTVTELGRWIRSGNNGSPP